MSKGWANYPRGVYPQEWLDGKIQWRMYELAEWKCEHCGMEFEPGTTKAKHDRNRDGKPVILTIHHLDGDKANCSWRNLLACCQACHLRIQATWSPGDVLPISWSNVVPLWLEKRNLAFQYHPQLPLFEGGLST